MHNKQKDKFDIHLDKMVIEVQTCQKQKSLKSCSQCKEFLQCKLREDYIKAVYNSMSKGDTGGFEF